MLAPLALALSLAVAADTITYPVMNHGIQAGEMRVVRDADSIVVTYAHIDRNRGRWVQARYGLDAQGRVISGETRPMTRAGVVSAPADRWRVDGDSIRYQRLGNEVSAARGNGFYALNDRTALDLAFQAQHLLAQPSRSATALPGTVVLRAEVVSDTTVRSARGNARVRFVAIHTMAATPFAVWIDERGGLVASQVAWFITVHPDFVDALPTFRAVEIAYRNAAGAALARRIPVAAQGSIAIRNATVFDSERGVAVPNQTILVQGDRITAVGNARDVRVPRGAQTIDAAGKTVIPGMWDMHTHYQLTSQTNVEPRHLAIGVTTVRDMAADTDVGVQHRDRAARGELVAPRAILGGFIEGPLLWRGPSDVLVHTEAMARDWVARYDSLGYRQIKLYNVVHPDLVPTIAAEVRRRGMRLSGHIPRGLSVNAAIRLGFDEINHGAFLFSTLYPDSVFVPEMRAYSLVASIVARNTNVDGPEMSALIADLKAHNTVVDGTFNLWMQDSLGADSTGARANNRAYLRLIKRLHDAGVTLVAGTDGSSYNRELEHYEMAGIPAREVLQIATITAARVMGEERDYGSIAAGKVADLVIIDGQPHERIADLRKVTLVMRGGRGYEPAALLQAVNTSVYR